MTHTDLADQLCRRCFVSGTVQGVFFRVSTRRRAAELGVSGWARNLSDGRVEVLCCGPAEAVESLCSWLRQGPEGARVSAVECRAEPVRPFTGFSIG